jgi:hypothetical protein
MIQDMTEHLNGVDRTLWPTNGFCISPVVNCLTFILVDGSLNDWMAE